MERLIQFFDDLDDLLGPLLAIPTPAQWVRAAGVIAAMAFTVGYGTSSPLAAMLVLPALPAAQLVHERVRRLAAPGLQMPALARFESEP